jgi:hypothetical protein
LIYPYKVHISRIPGYADINAGISRDKPLSKRIRRAYQYLYTGKNTDVLNFELKYNNLYFQTRLINDGQSLNLNSARGAKKAVEKRPVNVKKVFKDPTALVKTSQLAETPIRTAGYANRVEPHGDGSRGFAVDRWAQAAKNVHAALLQDVNMIKVDLEIIGDPYYLVQGGIGNIVSKPLKGSIGITDTGDADHQSADIYIYININSITDLSNDGGFAINNSSAAFSGIYRVTQIVSRFNGGVFTQKLSVLRINSQSIDFNPLTQYSGTPKTDNVS